MVVAVIALVELKGRNQSEAAAQEDAVASCSWPIAVIGGGALTAIPYARASVARAKDKNPISGGCLSEALVKRAASSAGQAACKVRVFFSRFLLARQKKSVRRRSTTGLCKQTHSKNQTRSTPTKKA